MYLGIPILSKYTLPRNLKFTLESFYRDYGQRETGGIYTCDLHGFLPALIEAQHECEEGYADHVVVERAIESVFRRGLIGMLQLFAVPADGLSPHRLGVEGGCYSCC